MFSGKISQLPADAVPERCSRDIRKGFSVLADESSGTFQNRSGMLVLEKEV